MTIGGLVARDLDVTTGGVLTANTLSTGNDLDLNVAGAAIAGTVTVAGDLGLTTSSAVTDTGSLTVSGETAITAGTNTVTLDSAGNDFLGAVGIVSAGTVTLVDRSALEVSGQLSTALNLTTGGALVLGTTDIGASGTPTAADLVIQSGGAITQKTGSDLTVYGDVDITAGANDVTLTAATNEITNQLTVQSAQNVSINVVDTNNDDTALTIGDFNAAGNVTISTDAALTQASTAVGSELNIAGDLTLAVSGKNGDICSDINLTNANNELLGDVRILNGEDVEIRTASALHLVSATICNNLNVYTGGKVYNSDAWVVVGDVVIDAGGADVDLTAGHDFKGSVSILDARNVVLNDVNELSFSTVEISGALTLTAGGAVSQTAGSTFTVDGSSTMTAVSNATYNLTVPGSGQFKLKTTIGNTDYTTVDIAHDASAAVIRGAILNSVSGAFSGSDVVVRPGSSGLDIIFQGTLAQRQAHLTVVTGSASLTPSTATGGVTQNVTLANAGNDFKGLVTVRGADVALNNGSYSLDLKNPSSGAYQLVTTIAGVSYTSAAIAHDADATAIRTAVWNSITATKNGSDLIVRGIDSQGVVDLAFTGNFAQTASLALGTESLNTTPVLATHALQLGSVSASGSLGLNAIGHVTDTGIVNVGTTTSVTSLSGSVTLDSVANEFTGAVSLSADNATIRDVTGTTLSTVSLTGNLVLTAGGEIAGTAIIDVDGTTALSASGQNISLTNAANDFTGQVTVTNAKSIDLDDVGGLTFKGSATGTDADLSLTTTGALTLVDRVSSTRDMTLAGVGVTLDPITVGGDLSINAGNGVLAQGASDAMRVTGTTTLSAGSMALSAANRLDAAVALTTSTAGGATGAVVLNHTADLNLAASSIAGDLTLTNAGNVTDSGALAVSGAATITLSPLHDLTLDTATNDFAGAVTVTSARHVTLEDANGLLFGALTAAGNVDVDAGTGSITQVADSAMTVTGTTAFEADGQISAGNTATVGGALLNDFIGAVTLTAGGATTIRDKSALNLASTVTGGNLVVQADGLLNFAATTVSGNVTATTSGAITDSGAFNVNGAVTLAAGAASDITLDHAGFDVDGALTVTAAKNLTLDSDDTLQFGAVTIAGALDLTSSGAITQANGTALTIAGTTRFETGTADVTLNNVAGTPVDPANTLTGAITITSAGNVALSNTASINLSGATSGDLTLATDGAVTLGTLTVGASGAAADLDITAVGHVTQATTTDLLTVYGDTDIKTSVTHDVVLANATVNNSAGLNTFIGAVTVDQARTLNLRNKVDLTTGPIVTTGDATVVTDQALSLGSTNVDGVLTAKGNFTLTSDQTAENFVFVSNNTFNMAGYKLTATGVSGSANSGYIRITAVDDVTLGQLVSQDGGAIEVSSTAGEINAGFVPHTETSDYTTQQNIQTAGEVSLNAAVGDLKLKFWPSTTVAPFANDPNNESVIDIYAGSIGELSAPGGLSVSFDGNAVVNDVLNTAGDLTIDMGSANLAMGATAAFRAGGNLTLTGASGSFALAELKAGDDKTLTVSTTGNVTGRNDLSVAHLTGGQVVLSGANLGSSTQALELVSTPSGTPTVDGSVRLVSVTGDAYLSLTNPLNTDANTTRQTVVLDAVTSAWDVAGSLEIDTTTANLEIKGAIVAESASIAAAGTVTMNNGTASITTDTANQALTVSGDTGVELGTLSSHGTVTVNSSAGSILDKRLDTTTNILTTGDVVLSARSIGSGGVGALDIDAAKIASVTATSANAGAAYLRLTATDGGVELDDASVTGVLSVIAPDADLTVSGAVSARSLVFNTTACGQWESL